MKKFIKILVLPLLAFILVACGNNAEEQPAESAPEETTEQPAEPTEENVEEETTDAETEDNADSENAEADNGADAPTEEDTQAEEPVSEEPSEDAVAFVFHVSGEEEPIAEFFVEDAEGLSVLDAMETIEELEFTFNEDEGVIDVIEGYENDYAIGNTWTYVLNGEYAQLGVVSQTLTASDQVDWYYGTIDEIPINEIIE